MRLYPVVTMRLAKRRGLHAGRSSIVLLLFVGLARVECAARPLCGLVDIGLAGCVVGALEIGFAAVGEVDVGHGVLVGRVDVHGLLKILQPLVHESRVLRLELGTGGLVLLGIAFAVVLDADIGKGLGGVLVGLRPVDDTDGVIRFSILGIFRDDLLLILLGDIELIDVEVDGGDLLERHDVMRIALEHDLEVVDGILRGLQIVRILDVGDDLLRVSDGEIETGLGIGGVELDRSLEVINGLLILRGLVSLHTLDELVAGHELAAAGGAQQSEGSYGQDGDSGVPFHALCIS